MRQKGRAEKGLDTAYSDDPDEIGNTEDYYDFLRALKRTFDEVYKVMKPKGYLTIITNNVFSDGRMYPLAFDTVSTLSQEPFAWTPKDRSEEHTSELQSQSNLVCRLLLEKKNTI